MASWQCRLFPRRSARWVQRAALGFLQSPGLPCFSGPPRGAPASAPPCCSLPLIASPVTSPLEPCGSATSHPNSYVGASPQNLRRDLIWKQQVRVGSAEVLPWEGGPRPLTGVLMKRRLDRGDPSGCHGQTGPVLTQPGTSRDPEGVQRPNPAEGAALPTAPSPGHESAVLVREVGSVGLCCEVPGQDCTEHT